MILAVTVFIWRAHSGSAHTPFSDGQVILSSKEYTFGSIYDRNNQLIVSGSESEIKWKDEEIQKAFSDILGVDIAETLNSHYTLCGNCPWLYGTEDNRFSMYGLLQPSGTRVGGSVVLTLDSRLQKYIRQITDKYEHAYVVVSNYKTGEILAATGGVFWARMHPGSTIKPVLAAAALTLNPEIINYTYTCNEQNHVFETKEGTIPVSCAENQMHGEIGMKAAMARSCNGYFVSLMNSQVNRADMLQALKNWGFDTTVSYSQFQYIDHSFLGKSSNGTDYLLASIGQANAYITPAGLNFCTNALLNHGKLAEPVWFTQKRVSPHEKWVDVNPKQEDRELCSAQTADQVVEMMTAVTTEGTGKSFYLPGFAAKTGTAEKSDENGSPTDKYTVWTTGGLTDENTPYSVTVCLDDVTGDVTSADAGMVANEVLGYVRGGN